MAWAVSGGSFVITSTPNEYGERVVMGVCARPQYVTISDLYLSKNGVVYEIYWQRAEIGEELYIASFVCPTGETPTNFDSWTARYYG